MKRLIALLAVVVILSGCVQPESSAKVSDKIHRWHDDEKNVTCWIYAAVVPYGGMGGISCIPDAQLDPR
jgi:hypothetical protein